MILWVPSDEDAVASKESPGKPEIVRSDDGKAANSKAPPDHVFAATTIKLTERHFQEWAKAYRHINLRAELWALDGWAGKLKAQGKDWFHPVSSALAKKEREAKLEMERARVEAEAAAKHRAEPKVNKSAIL